MHRGISSFAAFMLFSGPTRVVAVAIPTLEAAVHVAYYSNTSCHPYP